MNTGKLKTAIFLTCYFLIIAFFVIRFNLGYSASMILYLFIPSVFLSWQNKKIIKEVLFYTFPSSMLAVFIFDYMAHVSNAWYVPSELGIRVLGAFPVEEIVWSFLFFYFILIIYNTFFTNYQGAKIITTHTKYLVGFVVTMTSIFSFTFILNKDLLVVNNFYILLIIFMMVVPSAIFLYFRPHYTKKIILLTLVFAVPCLIYEYSALKTGQWFFNGEYYVGWLYLFDVRFPVEELLFILFAAPGVVSFYEFFRTDKK